MAVLALVTVTSLGLMVGSMQLDATNRENAQALAAATQVVERMQGRSFSQVLSLYNEATSDDPVAGGPAPGARFGVTGLRPSDDDPNVGRVRFPLAADGTLREDLQLPEFGMPMDLNGDGAIDGDDRSSDYVVLPVVIELRWTGRGGPRSLDVHALLMEGS